MKAGIYLRQSLDVAEGIERQRARCHSLLSARGWTLVEEYVDNDVSATKARGAGTAWSRLLEDARSRRLDVVVAVDLDRLLRDTRDLATVIDTGVKVLTVDGEIDLTTADGEFRATMLAGIARFEVRRKSERQVRANEARARAGKWVGGRRPFGYEADGCTLRARESDAVRQGYADVLTGVPLAAIARAWNAAGHSTGQQRQARSGHAGEPSPWRATSVRQVLTNPRYAGLVRYRGEIMAEPAEWEAIVDLSTWTAVQAVLENPTRRKTGRLATRLLTGIAVCGTEGCGATVHAGGNARRGVAAYRCSGSFGHFARRAEPVEEYVRAVVVARLSRQDARDMLLRKPNADTAALRAEVTGLEARLDSLASNWADGALTDSQLRTATARARSRLAELEGTLSDVGRVDLLGGLVGAPDVGEVWDAYSIDRQRAVLKAFLRVTIHAPGRGARAFRPDTVGIEWIQA